MALKNGCVVQNEDEKKKTKIAEMDFLFRKWLQTDVNNLQHFLAT